MKSIHSLYFIKIKYFVQCNSVLFWLWYLNLYSDTYVLTWTYTWELEQNLSYKKIDTFLFKVWEPLTVLVTNNLSRVSYTTQWLKVIITDYNSPGAMIHENIYNNYECSEHTCIGKWLTVPPNLNKHILKILLTVKLHITIFMPIFSGKLLGLVLT